MALHGFLGANRSGFRTDSRANKYALKARKETVESRSTHVKGLATCTRWKPKGREMVHSRRVELTLDWLQTLVEDGFDWNEFEMRTYADSSGIVSLYGTSTGRPGLEWCWGNILQGIGSTTCGSRTLNKKFGHWGEKAKLVARNCLDGFANVPSDPELCVGLQSHPAKMSNECLFSKNRTSWASMVE
ncbi:hypothetical protein B0H14DRAFT_2576219 [Mycena olivaceomarginata]|nr:hypothetical protein B0H14DRAFT_2576219 [Mycena olivaceomarginata]